MKLHLPKSLLTALLATFTVVTSFSSTAWGGWSPNDSHDLATTPGNIIYYLAPGDSGASINKADAVSTAPNDAQLPYTKVIIAAGREGAGTQDATLRAVSIDASDTLAVYRNPWTGELRDFNKLTIEELVIGDGTGAAAVDIGSNQVVLVNAVSGTLSSVTNAGNLTLGAVTIGGNIANNGTLNLAGTLNGSGAINNGDGAIVRVDTTGVLSGFSGVTYKDVNGNAAATNVGFISGEQTFRVLGEGVTYDGTVYVNDSDTGTTLTEEGYITANVGDSKVFYVADTWDYNAEQSSGAASFYVTEVGTMNIASGVEPSAVVNNHGNVVLQQGSANVKLNDLVDKNWGVYKPSVISNASTGNIIIDNTGNKTLSADITISNGGKVTLKGGTFGTANAAITQNIKTDNGTVLAFEDIDAYIGGGSQYAPWEIGKGATVHITGGDTFSWEENLNLTILTDGVLDLQKRQSIKSGSSIVLAGGTLRGDGSNDVSNDSDYYGLDIFSGGTVTTTENSRIETNIGGHSDAAIKFDVASGKTLTMTGDLVGKTTNSFEKSGDGVMVYSGEGFEQSLTISGGVFEYSIADERTHSAGISGTGTLRKSGEGTLTLSSANTTVTNLAVTGGKLVYNVEEEKTHTLSGTAGTFEKNGAGTLNLGALNDYEFSGELTVKEGKVVFDNSSADEDYADNDDYFVPSFVKLVNGLTTEGDGLVEILGNVGFNYQNQEAAHAVADIGANLKITGNLEINSWRTSNAPDGDSMRRWNVNEGGNLSVGGHLWLTNMQKMVVDGGSVSADGGVILGHKENNNTGQYKSNLVIDSGSVTTTGVTFKGGQNEVLMSGGELTFAPTNDGAQVLSEGSGENRFTVTGGTLKATDTGWALEGSDSHVVSLGNATFDIAADKVITLSGNIALTGALKVTGGGELKLGTTTFSTNTSVLSGLSYVCDEIDAAENGMSTIRYQVLTGDGTVSQPEDTSVSVSVAGSSFDYTWDSGAIVGKDSAFVINSTFSTADASAENGATMADAFVVNKTGVFTIADDITDGKTAKEILTETLGSGTISLQTGVVLPSGGSVVFEGDLVIAEGGSLTLGRGNGVDGGTHTQEYEANLSSLSALNLNGGTLNMYYVAPTIKSMTVETESTIYIDDVWADKQTAKADATRIDSLQLEANLSMETNWKSNVNIGVLSGGANLTVKQTQTINESKMSNLWIDGVNDYTGDISLSGKVALTLNIGAKESLNVTQLSKDSSSSITITGSGVLDLGDATTTFDTTQNQQKVNQSGVFSLGDSSNWTGTVRIQNATHNINQLGLNLNNLSNENSAVELINVNGWFTDTMVGKLILTADEAKNAAWTIVNGGSSKSDTNNMATFNGAVSGDGVMKYAWSVSYDNVDTYTGFTFNGDISGWNGAFVMDVSNSLTNFNYVLGGSAAVVNAAIGKAEKNKGKLHLKVNRDTTTTFNNTVKVDTLTTTGDGAVHFNKDVTVEDTVTAGGTLHVEDGTFVVQGTLNAADKSVELSGSYSNNVGTVGKSTAKLRLEGEENQVGTFDFGRNGFARGTLELGAESDTTAGALYMNKDVTISMEKGAQLTVGTSTAATDTAAAINALTSMTAASDKAGISIDDDSTDANTRGQFTHANNTKYVLTDMDVAVNYSSALTSKYRYDNSSVSNVGSAKLTLDNAANNLTGLKAELGSIDVLNKESLSLQELKVATSLTVGAYTAGTDSAKAGITVMECVEFGASATLNANLTVATGSTVKLDGYGDTAAMVAGSLTLHTGLILDGSVLGSLEALDAGDSLAIFKEVSALVFGGNAAEAAVMTLSESTLQEVDASVYFTNLAEGDYLLVYNGADGVVSIQATVPEPTTATLSLLALAALAARRRRRK